MAADPARRKPTYQDVLDLPEHQVGQILAGELVVQPRPSGRHAAVATALSEELGPPFRRGRGGPGGWILLFEPELHLADDIVVPDLAGWRRSRLPAIGDEAYFELPPDWVCEVLSPSTEKRDRTTKLDIYARERVGHVWLVNPEQRTLEVMRWTDEGWLVVGTHDDTARVRAEPFDAVELDLSVLWVDLAEAPKP